MTMKSKIILFMALCLLIVNTIGEYRRVNSNLNSINNFDIISSSDTNIQKMQYIYQFVVTRFNHKNGKGDGTPRYSLFDNYLLYFAGFIHPHLNHIKDPKYLFIQEKIQICSELSYLMVVMAEQQGIRARHVGLNGHVVMEAFYDDDWHMYDPLHKIIPIHNKEVKSVHFLERNPNILRKMYQRSNYSEKFIEHNLDIFTSKHDNTFISYPPLSQFNWKATVLLYFEKIMHYFKWLIPILLIMMVYFKKKVFKCVEL